MWNWWPPLPAVSGQPVLYSSLETQSIASTDRRVVFVTTSRIEAPNWLRDGNTLIYNSGGRIYQIPASGGAPKPIDTGFATRCNNDHGISPDGTLLAISDQSQGRRQSLIYTLPVAGGTPKLITPNGPSYWHGWSPDGKTLALLRPRDGEFDIYTIPADGGQETRLTTAKGLDDGPDTHRTASSSTSTPTALAGCKSGACEPTAACRNRSWTTSSTTGSRTPRPMAGRSSSSHTRRTSQATPKTRT